MLYDYLCQRKKPNGKSGTKEIELIQAAVESAKNAKTAVLLILGIGTIRNLTKAYEAVVRMVRLATHVTEADISAQHIEYAKNLGMTAAGFLIMAHMASTNKVVEQAKLMESYGADIVYVTASVGTLLPYQVREKIKALRCTLKPETAIGFHGHNNLSLALANSIIAIEEGAKYVDCSIRCLGAEAGNTQTEVLAGVFKKMRIDMEVDFYRIMALAEDIVGPMFSTNHEINRNNLMIGYAGVYSSFKLHAQRAANKFSVDVRDIFVELGRKGVIGGQEDMIVDVAAELNLERKRGI